MQSIAAEFNLAETTFVLPPKDPAHTAHVRIFTPKAEMPFAGHPNVGTAFVLARAGVAMAADHGDRLVFEEKAGLVPLDLTREQRHRRRGAAGGAADAGAGREVAPEIVAEVCGLDAGDIETAASSGHRLVRQQLRVRRGDVARSARQGGAYGPSVFRQAPADGAHRRRPSLCHAKEHGVEIQSRMFAPLYGVPEDPATGSANVALIGLLAHFATRSADLTLSKTIGQGFDMGRPSILEGTAEKKAGKVVATYIGGRCVPMLCGTIDLT